MSRPFSILPALLVLGNAFAADSPAPEKIPLWPEQAPVGDGTFEKTDARLTVHRPATANGAAMVICPGGGYGGLVVEPEGHGIAKWLNGHGITGIVLEYRLPRGRSAVPLLDAQRALRTVRANAKDWGCDPAKVGIIGFSAGGHLATTAATRFDDGDRTAKDPVERQSCRPDFAVLVYPVITMGESTHGGSRAICSAPRRARKPSRSTQRKSRSPRRPRRLSSPMRRTMPWCPCRTAAPFTRLSKGKAWPASTSSCHPAVTA